MKRLILNKLIVISQSESKSLEVPFAPGLNIIIGNNKTGKSSIIKSIFTSFGCECPKIETDWKKLISEYILFFSANEEEYCILRIGNRFSLFSVSNTRSYSCVIDTTEYTVFSNALMDILQVNMPCIDNYGNKFNITPPLLFRFQYIDQDEGWNNIGQAFKNMKYISKWKENTNKYVCGYHNDEYFSLEQQYISKQNQINEAKTEHSHNETFVNRIGEIINTQKALSPTKIQQELEKILLETDELRRQEFGTKTEIANIENDLFVMHQQLNSARRNGLEIKKDAEYAMSQGDVIICPVCGAHYDNGVDTQLHIAVEHASAENLINYLTQECTHAKERLKSLKENLHQIIERITENEKQIQHFTAQLSYKAYFIDEGKHDVYESCKQELQTLQNQIDTLIGEKSVIDDRMQKLKSKKRSKEIRDSLLSYCGKVADQINLSRTFIHLKDFVQTIDKSGSDTPRLVYMYHVALYLYNLERLASPFNFLVIDTPNQQGQDEENLNSIFSSLSLLQDKNGQVIIGTERITGLESQAANVVTLTEKRRCLSDKHYQAHLELCQKLHTLGLEWTSSFQT